MCQTSVATDETGRTMPIMGNLVIGRQSVLVSALDVKRGMVVPRESYDFGQGFYNI